MVRNAIPRPIRRHRRDAPTGQRGLRGPGQHQGRAADLAGAALGRKLAAERARADAAIAAFASLADKLDALAAERSRPWWRRLVS